MDRLVRYPFLFISLTAYFVFDCLMGPGPGYLLLLRHAAVYKP